MWADRGWLPPAVLPVTPAERRQTSLTRRCLEASRVVLSIRTHSAKQHIWVVKYLDPCPIGDGLAKRVVPLVQADAARCARSIQEALRRAGAPPGSTLAPASRCRVESGSPGPASPSEGAR